MTTQTKKNKVATKTSKKRNPSTPAASKFVSDLNDEINQMLQELNSVNLDPLDNVQWFEKPENELDSYSTYFDDDSPDSDQKPDQHMKNNKLDENEDQALWNRIDDIRNQSDDIATDNYNSKVNWFGTLLNSFLSKVPLLNRFVSTPIVKSTKRSKRKSKR